MVSRLSLIFWRWVVEVHDRLHTARDKAIVDTLRAGWRGEQRIASDTFTSSVKGANVTYDVTETD